VAHTPIDSNAILLRPGEVRTGLQAAGFEDVRAGYLMFFPPRLQLLGACERALGWLPLGAQYAVTARRLPRDASLRVDNRPAADPRLDESLLRNRLSRRRS
jgi:hypothetical protein